MRKPRYNTFDLSHTKKLSANIGELTPVLCMDLVPGDTVRLSSAQMVRFAPLVAPVMHRFDVYLHYFFVPNRIMWPNWETFITGGREGDDTTVPPFFNLSAGLSPGTLGDYLGLPTHAAGTTEMQVSAFPINGYERIFAEYYRDQNLQDFEPADLNDGGQLGAERYTSSPFNRAWKKDYFTSALPWTQRGPEATIPLGGVSTFDIAPDSAGSDFPQGSEIRVNTADKPGQIYVNATTPRTDLIGEVDPTSINDLRRAFRLQEFLEKNARGGARYTEVVLSHFGVRSSDARLQRPEFIGGSKTPIQISEVLQTSGSPSDTEYTPTPQGNMAGHGISVGGSQSFAYRAEEHGYLYAIMSVMPQPAYQQGIPKHFLRLDKLDYYWPSFANIGEQPIEDRELYWDPNGGVNNLDVFGYTPRYAEYKYMPSTVHGDFRDTLDFWHAGRVFATKPGLNSQFIQCEASEVERIFAVTDGSNKLWCQVAHNIKARRPMPYFGTPTI